MAHSLDTIFKAYDVRGLYPEELDESVAKKIGNAFARFTAASTVIVGRDMRPSSVPLSQAFIEGATLAGADVVDVGLASTDLVYFASGKLDAPAAMFTASHNPAQYNGIKMCRASAAPVGEATGLVQIKEAVAAGLVERAEEAGRVEHMDLLADFADHVRSFADTTALAPPAGRGRHRERHGRPRRPGGVRRPARSTWTSCSASSTARSRTTPPIRSSPRTWCHCRRRCSRRARTSGSRSTATPTACSSSTTRRS